MATRIATRDPLGSSACPPAAPRPAGQHGRAIPFFCLSVAVFIQVMALRKQVRVMEVELVQARLSGLAGGFGFGGVGAQGMGMALGGGGASAKAYRDALEETAELRRYVV